MSPLKIEFIAVHCSATKPSWSNIRAADITRMHQAREWRTIGYHRFIGRDGLVERGREFNEVGAHVAGFNSRSIGICIAGGVSETGKSEMNFTAPQLMSLDVLLEDTQLMFPNAVVRGHREFSPDKDGDGKIERHEWLKDCPCMDVQHFMKTGEALFYVKR